MAKETARQHRARQIERAAVELIRELMHPGTSEVLGVYHVTALDHVDRILTYARRAMQ